MTTQTVYSLLRDDDNTSRESLSSQSFSSHDGSISLPLRTSSPTLYERKVSQRPL